jgi:hypothetical protein
MHQSSCDPAIGGPAPVQLVMREVNLRIFELASRYDPEGSELYSFVCECSEPNCARTISLHLHRFDPTMPVGSLVAHVPDAEQEPLI